MAKPAGSDEITPTLNRFIQSTASKGEASMRGCYIDVGGQGGRDRSHQGPVHVIDPASSWTFL